MRRGQSLHRRSVRLGCPIRRRFRWRWHPGCGGRRAQRRQAHPPVNRPVLARSQRPGLAGQLGSTDCPPGEAGLTDDKNPDWLLCGPQASQALTGVIGDIDINHDGRSGLVFRSNFLEAAGAGNAGGVGVIFGRDDYEHGLVRVICEPDALWFGTNANDAVGRNTPTALGDLDGDGCEEFVVGADAEDFRTTNQGGVWVVYCWGGPSCPAEPRALHLLPGSVSAQAGFAVAGRGYLDGDSLPDLVVVGFNYRVDGMGMG